MLKKMILSSMSFAMLLPCATHCGLSKEDTKTGLISLGVYATTELLMKVLSFTYGKAKNRKKTSEEIEQEQPLLKKDAKDFLKKDALNDYAKKTDISDINNIGYLKTEELEQELTNFFNKNKKEGLSKDDVLTILKDYAKNSEIDKHLRKLDERMHNIETLVNKHTEIKSDDEKVNVIIGLNEEENIESKDDN